MRYHRTYRLFSVKVHMAKPPSRKRAIVGRTAPLKPPRLVNPRRICTADQRLAALKLMRKAGIPDAVAGGVFGLSHQQTFSLLGAHEPGPEIAPPAADAQARLAAELRAFRARHRLSQERLAAIIGLRTGSSVYAWETGRHGCAMPDLVLRFLRLLDEHPESLTKNIIDTTI
jgi:DNA-binding transcriptional regulator YiaG